MEKSYPKILGKETYSINPFSSPKFFNLLEDSNLLQDETGWIPLYFTHDDSILPSFIKFHSYGEYIFDWAWADFYKRVGINYYPKLTHTTPFTPVNAEKFHGTNKKELAKKSFDFYQAHPEISSEHYLFINKEETEILEDLGFSIMKTIQYHFKNKWSSFDDFLSDLKPGRRKMIKKERKKCNQYSDITIGFLKTEDITNDVLEQIYKLYISTIIKKYSQAYLNEDFFKGLVSAFGDNLKVCVAKKDNEIIAMSLFLKSDEVLYGRYWGIKPEYEKDYSFLHFELCYYQGMEYVMQNSMSLFEAGAQGEQKLWRGFTPIEILSAHHIRIPKLFEPIINYIEEQNSRTEEEIKRLKTYLPFKETNEKA